MTAYRTIGSTNPNRPYDFSNQYELLVGPEFKCLITEPEDRSFYRDLSCVIDRLNAQHAVLQQLRNLVADAYRMFDGGDIDKLLRTLDRMTAVIPSYVPVAPDMDE